MYTNNECSQHRSILISQRVSNKTNIQNCLYITCCDWLRLTQMSAAINGASIFLARGRFQYIDSGALFSASLISLWFYFDPSRICMYLIHLQRFCSLMSVLICHICWIVISLYWELIDFCFCLVPFKTFSISMHINIFKHILYQIFSDRIVDCWWSLESMHPSSLASSFNRFLI